MKLWITTTLLSVLIIFGGTLLLMKIRWDAPFEYEYVSEDGGFVAETGFKRPLESVERSFERYRFLRSDPEMPLYRTTKLRLGHLFSGEARYKYRPSIEKKPVDWLSQLREKCVQEYIPNLPTVIEHDEVRFFFLNQYDDVEINIYGYSRGKVFGINIRQNPKYSGTGETWNHPIWCHTREIDIQDPHWRRIWHFVNAHREELIANWDQNREEYMKGFDRRYDWLYN